MPERVTLAGAAILLALIGLSPVFAMVVNTIYIDGGFSLTAYHALLGADGQLVSLMGRSLVLSLLTAGLATIVGVPLGILLGKSDLPFRGPLTAVFAVPLLIPPYVFAVAWFGVLGKTGWLGQALPPAAADLVSTAFFGLSGCVFVLYAAFVPVVMLLTITYLKAVNPRWEDAARLVGGWPRILLGITLPPIAPGILFAAVLVFLLTLGEVGVPTFLRYPVYAAETLTQFAAFYDFRAATVSASPLLFVTLAILALQYRLHGRVLELGRGASGAPSVEIDLGKWRLPLFALVLGAALVTVALPLAVLIVQSSSPAVYLEAFSRAGGSIMRSLGFAAIGASLLAVLGFFCGYLIAHRSLAIWRGIDWLALLLFTLPGTVIGIGLISLWNTSLTNWVYATPAILILGYLAQYAILPMRMTSASLEMIPRSLEQAARLSGAGWFMTLRHITVPLARRGLIAAWLIGYVFCLRDLGISMIVYPPGSDTLPVRIFTLMANGAPSLIAALCIILVAITVVPLGVAGLLLKVGARRP